MVGFYLAKPQAARGGWRQQATEDVAKDQEVALRIVMGHLQDWAYGVSSSTAVKRHTEYAVADGVTHHMVERKSRSGAPTAARNIAIRT